MYLVSFVDPSRHGTAGHDVRIIGVRGREQDALALPSGWGCFAETHAEASETDDAASASRWHSQASTKTRRAAQTNGVVR